MRKRAGQKKTYFYQIRRFNDQLVTRFVNNLMWDGKKSTAFKVFYDALTSWRLKSKMRKNRR